MPYVRQVLEEAMRLYPPVGLLARNVAEPDILVGREVLPNDIVFLAIYALHRHEMWWDRPNAFDPDNFAPGPVRDRHRYLYLPFGAGPRVCVGANFAMMQAQIILSTLLARYRFDLAGKPPPVPTMSMTVRPEGGVWLTATPRCDSRLISGPERDLTAAEPRISRLGDSPSSAVGTARPCPTRPSARPAMSDADARA